MDAVISFEGRSFSFGWEIYSGLDFSVRGEVKGFCFETPEIRLPFPIIRPPRKLNWYNCRKIGKCSRCNKMKRYEKIALLNDANFKQIIGVPIIVGIS
jgi:hypothetical protein